MDSVPRWASSNEWQYCHNCPSGPRPPAPTRWVLPMLLARTRPLDSGDPSIVLAAAEAGIAGGRSAGAAIGNTAIRLTTP